MTFPIYGKSKIHVPNHQPGELVTASEIWPMHYTNLTGGIIQFRSLNSLCGAIMGQYKVKPATNDMFKKKVFNNKSTITISVCVFLLYDCIFLSMFMCFMVICLFPLMFLDDFQPPNVPTSPRQPTALSREKSASALSSKAQLESTSCPRPSTWGALSTWVGQWSGWRENHRKTIENP